MLFKISSIAAVGALLFSVSSTQAQITGLYERYQKNNFGQSYISNAGGALLRDTRTRHEGFICTDVTSNLVPGKLINNVCYVEWDGGGYGNEDFYVLAPATSWSGESYNFVSVNLNDDGKQFALQYGITPGSIDAGNFVYHCYVKSRFNNDSAFGKYIPNMDTCYFEYKGRSKSVNVNTYGYEFGVLTYSNSLDRSSYNLDLLIIPSFN